LLAGNGRRRSNDCAVCVIAPITKEVGGLYCTVSVNEAVCESDPEVAVTVMMEVPLGVVFPEPPQPVIEKTAITSRVMPSCMYHQILRRRRNSVNPRTAPPPRNARALVPPAPWNFAGSDGRLSAAVLTLVAIVKVAVDALVPLGVTEVGLMLQLACCGAPEQARVTAWLNPPAGVTLIVDVALLPFETVPVVGERLRVKLGVTAALTVMVTAAEVDGENAVAPP
jgi:hypothetical protein